MDEPEPKIRELWRFAATRDFVVGRDELVDYGFGPHQIRSWLRSGRLLRVVRGVYSYGRDIASPDAAWRTALLAAGPGSALTGVSACQKWGFVELRDSVPAVIEVASRAGKARSVIGVSPAMKGTRISVSSRKFEETDTRRMGNTVLLSPVQALIDLSASASERETRLAFLEACRLGLFRAGDVQVAYRMLVGRRGARKLRPLLGLWRPELNRIRSVYEGLFLLAWIDRGYHLPLINEKIGGKEVDCYWPDQGFVLELDGGTYHRGLAQHSIDSDKQSMLEGLGLTVDRLGYGRFELDPYGEVDRIAMRLGFRGGGLNQ